MAAPISRGNLDGLKRRARRLERERPELSHSEALDLVARDEGFKNWSLLARAAEDGNPAVTVPMQPVIPDRLHTVELHGWFWNRPARPAGWTEAIPAKYPPKRYADFQWVKEHFQYEGREDLIRSQMARARRTIAFMDTTGLRTSRAFRRIFPDGRMPEVFDHTSVWRDETGRYVLTTEPYAGAFQNGKLIVWCRESGWDYVVAPKQVGLWNPCTDACLADCTTHTQMVLLAPPRNGGSVLSVSHDLEAFLPLMQTYPARGPASPLREAVMHA